MLGRNLIRYWGKKPRELAQQYINRYSKPGEIVADTFGGSGVFVKTALEFGRRAIYIDLNPFAELIAHSLIEGCDFQKYEQAIQLILSRKTIPVKINGKKAHVKTRELFYVKCPCGRGAEANFVAFTKIYSRSSSNPPKLKGLKFKITQVIWEKGEISHNELCKLNRNITSRSLSSAIKWLVRHNII
jgi:hypothetical protein